ncbi:MAG: cytochrome c oxidase subunit II [Haloarculaceae archaeon]
MRIRRKALGSLAALAALLVVAVGPAAAQSSVNEALIRGLNENLLYVAIPLAVLVELILFYAVYRFKDADEAKPTQENRRLEITWTVATAIILLFVGFTAYQVLGVPLIGGVTAQTYENVDTQPLATTHHGGQGANAPPVTEPDAVQVEVVAQKYYWTYNYPHQTAPNNDSEFVSRSSLQGQPLVIPADRPVYFHVTSLDWLHAFHVPGLALKQDAFPGKYNTIKTVALEPGSYQLYCAEYCGVGHSNMLGTVEVLPSAENPENPAEGTYEHWIQQRKSELASESGSGAGAGTNATNATSTGTASLAGV